MICRSLPLAVKAWCPLVFIVRSLDVMMSFPSISVPRNRSAAAGSADSSAITLLLHCHPSHAGHHLFQSGQDSVPLPPTSIAHSDSLWHSIQQVTWQLLYHGRYQGSPCTSAPYERFNLDVICICYQSRNNHWSFSTGVFISILSPPFVISIPFNSLWSMRFSFFFLLFPGGGTLLLAMYLVQFCLQFFFFTQSSFTLILLLD